MGMCAWEQAHVDSTWAHADVQMEAFTQAHTHTHMAMHTWGGQGVQSVRDPKKAYLSFEALPKGPIGLHRLWIISKCPILFFRKWSKFVEHLLPLFSQNPQH